MTIRHHDRESQGSSCSVQSIAIGTCDSSLCERFNVRYQQRNNNRLLHVTVDGSPVLIALQIQR